MSLLWLHWSPVFPLFRSIGDLCPAGSSSCSQHLLTSRIDEPASHNISNVPVIALPGISGSVCWVLFFCINQNCSGLWCELVFCFPLMMKIILMVPPLSNSGSHQSSFFCNLSRHSLSDTCCWCECYYLSIWSSLVSSLSSPSPLFSQGIHMNCYCNNHCQSKVLSHGCWVKFCSVLHVNITVWVQAFIFYWFVELHFS